MADNYVQFSEGLQVDDADRQWIKDKIDYFETPPDPDGEEWEEFLSECGEYDLDDIDQMSGLDIEVQFAEREVIFYAEEYGNWYHAAKLVQDLFRERHPDASWCIAWAETCSKARPGEFGGGAAFVTAERIEILSTYEWLQKKADAWNKRKKK